jgi:hypothetical protein
MFRRPTPALAIALVALFFSLSGAALAAKDYVINATSDINPKVLKALKGQKGSRGFRGFKGATGAPGAPGAAGAAGAVGAPGPFPDALPSGKTTRGSWVVVGSGISDPGETAISFVWPVALRPQISLIPAGGPAPAGCSGSVDHPSASPGNLCIFEGWTRNSAFADLGDYDPANGVNNVSGFQGIVIFANGTTTGFFEAAGSYAVTAP